MKNKVPNLLVLNPYSQGFFVFTKLASGDLERRVDVNSARQIFHAVSQLPKPRVAVHLGRAYDRFLVQILSHETDLCTIPMTWMSHIPFSQYEARARLAAQLAEAYLVDPIRLFGAKEPNDPFAA
jgi:hypothetical protein